MNPAPTAFFAVASATAASARVMTFPVGETCILDTMPINCVRLT